MKKIFAQIILPLVFLILFILIIFFFWNRDEQIRLVVRGDDMGFHTISPDIYTVTFNLMKEYNLDLNIRLFPLKMISLFGAGRRWESTK